MLSAVFKSIYYAFYDLAYRFLTVRNWAQDQLWPLSWLEGPFYVLYSIAQAIGAFFYDAYRFALNVEEFIDEVAAQAKQAFDYAYDVLRLRVNEALNDARDAWNAAWDAFDLADDAWDYATGWLKDKAVEAWNRAGEVWGTVTEWVRDKAIEAYNMAVAVWDQITAAVQAAAQDIYAWVKTIPLEIRDFIDGVVATLQTWAGGAIDDVRTSLLATFAAPFNLINLWFDDIQDFFNSPLDWLGNKFVDWFLGGEE